MSQVSKPPLCVICPRCGGDKFTITLNVEWANCVDCDIDLDLAVAREDAMRKSREALPTVRQARLREIRPMVIRGYNDVGPCPCECNSGGFCGGCGHAGCGKRR